MIGSHNIDRPVEQRLPQRVLLLGIAQRRRALCDGAQPFQILFGEEQIMRTGFDRNIYAAGLGLGRCKHAAP